MNPVPSFSNPKIIEQVPIREALRQSEQRYRLLFEKMAEGFALFEIICGDNGVPFDYKFLDVNPAFEQLTRLKHKDVNGKTIREVFADNAPQWVENCSRAAVEQESRRFQIRVPRLNRNYDVYAFSPAEKQFAVLFTDSTERHKKERELNRLNRTLRALSDSSKALTRNLDNEQAYLDAVCQIIVEDCGHKMVWIGYAEDDEYKTVRPAAYSGFDKGYLDVINVSWGEKIDRGQGPTGTAVRTGKVCMCPNMRTDPKFKPWRDEAGKRGYLSSIVFPLMEGAKAFGVLTIYSKETDPFSADEVKLLIQLAEDLAYGIITIRARAEAKQTQEKLVNYKNMLERQTKELEEIIGVVSHDLRAPLVNVRGFNSFIKQDIEKLKSMLAEAEIPSGWKKELDAIFEQSIPEATRFIDASADSMSTLVKSLVGVARVGLAVIKPEVLNMNEIVIKAVASLEIKFKKSGAQVIYDNLPYCWGDRVMVTQIFTNLIDNAVKYLDPARKGQICIGGQTERDRAIFCVSDNGVGIEEKDQERVFELFTRLASRAHAGGEGMGLAMVKRLVDKNSGKIWLASEKGKGSSFFVALPIPPVNI